jgi:hypothetical protein
MAVAKCAKCKATVTVVDADGSLVITHGESFLTGCKNRPNETAIETPSDCSAMRSAITKAGRRAKIERPSSQPTDMPIVAT